MAAGIVRIGEAVPRREDARLLKGDGSFSDDLNLPGQLYAAFVRSPHAHARIGSIDTARAGAPAGVHAVLTAADYAADGLNGIRHVPNTVDAVDPTKPAFANRDGSAMFDAPQPVLADERVRHVGEAVALVIADSRTKAEDAAELVAVAYGPLGAVTAANDALGGGAAELWTDAPGNLCLDAELGDEAATGAAFANAAHVIAHDFVNNRIVNAQMEPRAAIGDFDPVTGVSTLYAGSQGVVRHRGLLAQCLGVPAERVRVVCGDVGGGFGLRNMMYAEFVAVAWAAKRLGRPVKWTGSRAEAFSGDHQGRDLLTRAALALDAGGRMLAMKVELLGNVGAHGVSFVPLANGSRLVSTVYDVPCVHVTVRGALTNTAPTAPYRGAGRPEAMLVMERLIDMAARRTGIDRIELRRINLVPPGAMPYLNPCGLTYDCGEFETVMERTLELTDWDGFAERKAAARAAGKLRGIGLANYIESPVGAPIERAEMTVLGSGRVRLVLGTQSSGQGHETSFAQVVSGALGVPFDAVDLITGDTEIVSAGGGTHSDRSMRIAGTLMVRTAADIVEMGKAAASVVLEAAVADIVFADGVFGVAGTDKAVGLFELALACEEAAVEGLPEALAAEADFRGRIPAYPNGCAVCEVEIDADTGAVEIARYGTVDDPGRVINPLIVEGQIHGGIAQGVGQAVMENCVYEPESGQLVTGSLMDYAVPRADSLPSFRLDTHEVPSPGNPLGVKGGGEGGITPALGAVVNAVADALAEFGVEDVQMPVTAERIWRIIEAAKDNTGPG